DVHVPDGDRVVVGLTGATVVERGLAVLLDQPAPIAVLGVGRLGREAHEDLLDRGVLLGRRLLVPERTVEHRGGDRHGGRGGGAGLLLVADGLVADRTGLLGVPAPAGGVAEV